MIVHTKPAINDLTDEDLVIFLALPTPHMLSYLYAEVQDYKVMFNYTAGINPDKITAAMVRQTYPDIDLNSC